MLGRVKWGQFQWSRSCPKTLQRFLLRLLVNLDMWKQLRLPMTMSQRSMQQCIKQGSWEINLVWSWLTKGQRTSIRDGLRWPSVQFKLWGANRKHWCMHWKIRWNWNLMTSTLFISGQWCMQAGWLIGFIITVQWSLHYTLSTNSWSTLSWQSGMFCISLLWFGWDCGQAPSSMACWCVARQGFVRPWHPCSGGPTTCTLQVSTTNWQDVGRQNVGELGNWTKWLIEDCNALKG